MYEAPDLERLLQEAIAGVTAPNAPLFDALDRLPAPIYVTDADGIVIHFTPACIDFAGRRPVVGEDRWCVTWKLYTDKGEALPHDQCPMAVAIRRKKTISGLTAIAERPDGTRVRFKPHAVPLIGEDGKLRGAVNMLIDITDGRQARLLRAQADRARRLAAGVSDRATVQAMRDLADDLDCQAEVLERPL